MSILTKKELLDLVAVERMYDYASETPAQQRDKLVKLWREGHPDAARETSVRLHPLMKLPEIFWGGKRKPEDADEMVFNDVYLITIRRHKKDSVFGTDGGMIQLGISSLDGTARHDWRDFQWIKNSIAGPECEAFELYPAESRLLDPSNYYSLWCFPGVKRLKIGIQDRDVRIADEALCPQRDFPDDRLRPTASPVRVTIETDQGRTYTLHCQSSTFSAKFGTTEFTITGKLTDMQP